VISGLAFGGGRSDEYDGMRVPHQASGLVRLLFGYYPKGLRRRVPTDGPSAVGLALLIAEAEECGYEPVGIVSSIDEAVTLSREDFAARCADLEEGGSPMCPERYVVWARTSDGTYQRHREFIAVDLLGGPAR
jgi:hypothetical protein